MRWSWTSASCKDDTVRVHVLIEARALCGDGLEALDGHRNDRDEHLAFDQDVRRDIGESVERVAGRTVPYDEQVDIAVGGPLPCVVRAFRIFSPKS